MAMANYDLTFHFPQAWSLIATGKRVSLERDGGGFVGHWVSEQPIPIAGFNLGEYVRAPRKIGKIEVDAYAARGSEIQRSTPDARERSPSVAVAARSWNGGARTDAAALAESHRPRVSHWPTARRTR